MKHEQAIRRGGAYRTSFDHLRQHCPIDCDSPLHARRRNTFQTQFDVRSTPSELWPLGAAGEEQGLRAVAFCKRVFNPDGRLLDQKPEPTGHRGQSPNQNAHFAFRNKGATGKHRIAAYPRCQIWVATCLSLKLKANPCPSDCRSFSHVFRLHQFNAILIDTCMRGRRSCSSAGLPRRGWAITRRPVMRSPQSKSTPAPTLVR